MKPPEFDYLRAETVEEALESLAKAGEDARILAGGQSLIAMLNLRLIAPDLLIDISRIPGLDRIKLDGEWLEVGAAATQSQLHDFAALSELVPLLDRAIPYLGHFQTRNKGTVCGSIAHADPSSELPLCLATLGGEVVLASTRGERTLSAEAFQVGMLETAREPDEIVRAVRFPVSRPGEGFAFTEVSMRRGDFAIVGLTAVVGAGRVRLGAAGLSDKPSVREWGELSDSALDDALNAWVWELGGFDDGHASAAYRREIVRRLGPAVVEEAKRCRS